MKNGSRDRTTMKLVGRLLSEYVGRGQQKTYAQVAFDAECSETLLYALKRDDEGVSVGTDKLMDIVRALPDEAGERFIRETLGFFGARRIDGASPCHTHTHFLIARAGYTYADFLQDRQLDHRELTILETRVIPELAVNLSRYGVRA